MTTLMDVLLVVGMFLLRIGVPLLLTLALGYALSRLDARWQAEADAARRAEQAARRQPAPGLLWPRPTMAASALSTEIAGAPCWSVKGCGETQRQACPAFRQPSLPCWMARWHLIMPFRTRQQILRVSSRMSRASRTSCWCQTWSPAICWPSS